MSKRTIYLMDDAVISDDQGNLIADDTTIDKPKKLLMQLFCHEGLYDRAEDLVIRANVAVLIVEEEGIAF